MKPPPMPTQRATCPLCRRTLTSIAPRPRTMTYASPDEAVRRDSVRRVLSYLADRYDIDQSTP